MKKLFNKLDRNWKYIGAVAVVAGTLVGWALTYAGWRETHRSSEQLERQKFELSLKLDARRAELKFVSDQIQHLYGPLFALSSASRLSFTAFLRTHAAGRRFFFDGTSRTPEELRLWRIWMAEVFMPLNLRMERAITENAHLIAGSSMPESFQDFLSHVAVYKGQIKRWEEAKQAGSLDKLTEEDHVSIINFPVGFYADIQKSFIELRARQNELLLLTKDAQDLKKN